MTSSKGKAPSRRTTRRSPAAASGKRTQQSGGRGRARTKTAAAAQAAPPAPSAPTPPSAAPLAPITKARDVQAPIVASTGLVPLIVPPNLLPMPRLRLPWRTGAGPARELVHRVRLAARRAAAWLVPAASRTRRAAAVRASRTAASTGAVARSGGRVALGMAATSVAGIRAGVHLLRSLPVHRARAAGQWPPLTPAPVHGSAYAPIAGVAAIDRDLRDEGRERRRMPTAQLLVVAGALLVWFTVLAPLMEQSSRNMGSLRPAAPAAGDGSAPLPAVGVSVQELEAARKSQVERQRAARRAAAPAKD